VDLVVELLRSVVGESAVVDEVLAIETIVAEASSLLAESVPTS
jgi:hypothetical protein